MNSNFPLSFQESELSGLQSELADLSNKVGAITNVLNLPKPAQQRASEREDTSLKLREIEAD